jgi:transcriptional regulator
MSIVYKIPYFLEHDQDIIMEFLAEHPLALITGNGTNGKPVATQVPIVFDERDGLLILTGHVMRGTDHWHGFNGNSDVLAVFTGPNCPVSASWYSNKNSGGTWNYMSVHARGTIRFLDQEALVELLRRLTNQFENDPNSGANFEDLAPDYVAKMLPAIQAFEITVTELDAIFKLSQNRDQVSYDNIIRHLEQRPDNSSMVAAEMKRRREKVFEGS